MELSISVALLAVISLLGVLASSASLKSASLTRSMTTLQEELRSTMRALSDQVQPAVKAARVGFLLPLGAQSLRIVNTATPTAITFVVPTNMTGTAFSGVNTIQFENEDTPAPGIDGGEFGNGRLDSGEDDNGNGRLDRQLVWIQPNGTRQMLGGGNHLANMTFNLSADGSMLEVAMVATTRLEAGKNRMLQYRLASNIYIMN
jgi:hypothetical protein